MPGKDRCGYDSKIVNNWSSTYTLEQLKEKVVENKWSGFGLGHPGVWSNTGCVFFKKVDYILTPENVHDSPHILNFWAYNPIPYLETIP
jgi:hypothetical protein